MVCKKKWCVSGRLPAPVHCLIAAVRSLYSHRGRATGQSSSQTTTEHSVSERQSGLSSVAQQTRGQVIPPLLTVNFFTLFGRHCKVLVGQHCKVLGYSFSTGAAASGRPSGVSISAIRRFSWRTRSPSICAVLSVAQAAPRTAT